MKYKVGDKFIVEILGVDSNLSAPYETALSRFTECQLRCIPQLVKGVDTYSYNKGAEDAWELMKRINEPRTMPENLEMFRALGVSEFCQVFELLTPQEAKTKFDAWKKANKEIKVGDVVNMKNNRNDSGIVFAINGEWCSLAWSDGYCGSYLVTDLIKTGENHADEVADIIGLLK